MPGPTGRSGSHRVVHEHGEAVEALDDRVDETVGGLFAREVGREEGGRPAGGGDAVDDGRAPLRVAPGDGHGRAFAGEDGGDRTADARRRPGDECDLPLQPHEA